ncbi:hypothetical protein LXA43DRAFT_82324 [Ganoderma leucocontextum]|nr:hypothetical protein LXA43DRAFT_82324 [Ganoderma leucocontextum]
MNARLEEAAQIAMDYLSSLGNLPQEAQHLLEEIRHLDVRTQEITDVINEETRKYFHHSREKKTAGRAAGPTSSSTTAAAVDGMYDEVHALAAEKVALSGRLVKLFERAMARLQHDLGRIVELQGDEPGLPATEDFLNGVEDTVLQIRDLQAAAVQGIGSTAPPAASSSAASSHAQKKRKTILPDGKGKASNSVPVTSGRRNTSQKSGPSRVVQPRQTRVRAQNTAMPAKRRHNVSDGEDDGPYCYCQDGSWGEMIACDNPDCLNEWFHLSCAGLTSPLPRTWYCNDCRQDLDVPHTGTSTAPIGRGRKGQKKQ